MRRAVLVILGGFLATAVLPASQDSFPAGKSVTPFPDSPKQADQLRVSDPAEWKFGKDAKGESYLELAYDRKKHKSAYVPKYRSPVHIALLATRPFESFTMDVEMMSTTEPYGHQSLCLFFGFQSPEKYYYVHLGRVADMNANNVFIVNGAPRKNFAKETSKGVDWKQDTWQRIRLTRDVKSGKIEVFFEDFTNPIMVAEDKTFASGYVGVGSFDDTGKFRNGKIYSTAMPAAKQLTFFKPLAK
jgi:hypothetical protein